MPELTPAFRVISQILDWGVKSLIAQHTLAYYTKVFLQVCNLHFYTRKSNVRILCQSLPDGQYLVFVAYD
jgi:hypothetical protein